MSIRRNTIYNLVGSGVPVVLAIATVPAYLRLIGPDRYGVLSIAWLLLGYFGLFDLGLGRATSQRIAALRDASGRERGETLWTALTVNVAMGLIGMALLWPVSAWFFATQFKVDEALRAEILTAVPLLALSLPVATITGVLTGALQGRERFLETNTVSATSTILFQLLPLLVAFALVLNGEAPNLSALLIAALAARVVALFVLWRKCRREVEGVAFAFDRAQARGLLGYGGWVTVTSMFGPLLFVTDRFFIGAVLGAYAVTVYALPLQIAQRLTMIPQALANALFPRISAGSDKAISEQAIAILVGGLTPIVLVALLTFEPFLQLWVGAKLGSEAAPIGRLLLIAFWINSIAYIPYTQLQAQGRPDLVSKALLIEVPFYLAALWIALHAFGLIGACWIMIGRFAVDYLIQAVWAFGRVPSWRASAAAAVLLLGQELVLRPGFAIEARVGASLLIALGTAALAYRLLPLDRLRALPGALLRRVRPAMGSR